MTRRQSAQRGSGFMKWQPHESEVRFEQARRRHARVHRAQLVFDAAVVVCLLAAALVSQNGGS